MSLTAVVWFVAAVSTIIDVVTEVPLCTDIPACVATLDLVLTTCYTHGHNKAAIDCRLRPRCCRMGNCLK